MGLLTPLFQLPFLPLKALIRVAELIAEETARELHNPARVRRELEEAQRQRAAGGISEDELSRVEYEATGRLLTGMPVTTRQTRTGADRDG